MYGRCHPPGGNTIESGSPWDAGHKITMSDNTAWELLRACLIWFIWVNKCNQELNSKSFSTGKVLFYAWKTTIQIGMEVWNELHRHKRREERKQELLLKFGKRSGQTTGFLPQWKPNLSGKQYPQRFSSLPI